MDAPTPVGFTIPPMPTPTMAGMNWSAYDAVLFDLDGVLTPTAEVHMRAWEEMFNGYLSSVADQPPYTSEDYFAYVDGKPRYDGVRSFLESRGIELPDGDPSDAPSEVTVCGLGNSKNDVFNEILARDGVTPYPGSIRLLDAAADLGLAMAVVSSSKNAPAVLAAAGLAERFSVVIDGTVAVHEGLAGKPSPETFLHAAAELGVSAASCVVVEDAVSGVEAGASGGFGCVLGVDRGAGAEVLRAAGADIVVTDLEEVLP